MKFFTKLIILTFTVIAITGTLIYYFVYTSNLKILEAEIKDRLEDQAFHIMDKIDRVLYERRADIQMIATDPIISSRDSNPRQIAKRLIEMRNIYKTYVSLSFFDLNRIRIADTAGLDIGRQHPLEIYWKDLLEGEISAGSEISVSKSLKIPVIFFASPVKDRDGKTFGFVVARMPLGKLYEITKEAAGIHEVEEEFEIDLLDKNGLLLYSNYNKKGILKDNYRDLESVKRSMAGEKIGSLIQPCPLLKKEKDICAFVHEQGYLDFKGNDWTLLVHIFAKTVFAPAFELRNKIIGIIVTVLIGSVLVVYFTTKIITKPIDELSSAVAKIGKGELDTKINIKTKDEIGQLATAFKKMTEDLQKTTVSKDYVDNIIGSMIDTLVVVTPDGKIKTVNRATCELLGYKEEELIGEDVTLLFPEEEEEEEEEEEKEVPLKGTKLERLIKEGSLINYEINYKTKDGRKIPVLFNGSVMRDKEGNIISIVCMARDITERKKAEEALKDYTRQIEEVNKELDDFTYIVSHDLKEPLRSIDAFSKFIENDYRDKLGEEGRNYFERIRVNVARMQNLIEDLLEISRIERRKNPFEEVEIEELVNEVKLRLGYVIKEKNAEIVIKDKLPKVFCDRVRLAEVFINLISNAIKFTDKQKPTVEIGCRQKGVFYEFYVKDNGPGIEEQYFDKIFEIFQRLGRREEQEGTGAGLTIAKKIVEMHKGKIWVESKIGEGSTFYFTIPKKKELILGKKKIGEILIEKKLITEAELKKALEEQKGTG